MKDDFKWALSRASGVFAVSLLLGCASVAGAAQKGAAASNPRAETAEANCFAIGEVSEREACFAGMSEQALAECARVKPLACTPYRDMHAEGKRMARLTADIEALSRKAYASYTQGDQAYLDDLTTSLRDADLAWRRYRDAECLAQPFLDGMSRSEAGDLTEACRLDLTRKRISELEGTVTRLKEEAKP
jgi:uncharacterized protein YecT (DUF1311 family)